jgi:hypothetical protein
MTYPARLLCCVLLLPGAVMLTGCWFQGHSRLDEEKEPHFIAGKNRVNEMDDPGAIECFQRALEVNPRSSAAHFELGLLYEKSKQDYASAVYHFERFLDLRPKSDFAGVVHQRILACKQELAKTVSLETVTQSLQTELEALTGENKRLREEMEALRAYYTRPQTNTGPTHVAARPMPVAARPTAAPIPAGLPVSSHPAPSTRVSAARPEAMAAVPRRTHTIQPGETPISIARRYGVKVETLMAANPAVDSRRLQVGRSLKVPVP